MRLRLRLDGWIYSYVPHRIRTGIANVFFVIVGLAFSVLMTIEVIDTAKTRFWQETACTILRSEAIQAIKPCTVSNDHTCDSHERFYTFNVTYSYRVDENSYESRTYNRKYNRFASYSSAQSVANRYREGEPATCYVNPENPEEAVLAHDSLWIIPFYIIPLSFMGFGIFGIIRTICGRENNFFRKEQSPEHLPPSVTGQRLAILLLIIFVIAGAGLITFHTIKPLVKMRQATDWPMVPCEIISSQVASGPNNKTYKVDILYEYEFEGIEYKSSRYGFLSIYSSGREEKATIVSRYPAGTHTHCYVNPEKPFYSILHRGFDCSVLWGLLGLPIMLLGLVPLLLAWRNKCQNC